jgi:hypothetical protein
MQNALNDGFDCHLVLDTSCFIFHSNKTSEQRTNAARTKNAREWYFWLLPLASNNRQKHHDSDSDSMAKRHPSSVIHLKTKTKAKTSS